MEKKMRRKLGESWVFCMVLYGFIWFCMVLYGFVWFLMVSYGLNGIGFIGITMGSP
jgi:hypothetical protein